MDAAGDFVEFWQLIVGMAELQELQQESICQLRDALDDSSDFAKALDDLLEKINKDPVAYMLEHYCTDIVLGELSKAVQKAVTKGIFNISALTVSVAELMISLAVSVYPGTMADEIYQTTLLSSYVSEFDAAITSHRAQFILKKVNGELLGQDEIAEYEYLYNAYITTIRETLKSALHTAKTEVQKGNIQHAIDLCDKFTYETYIAWCMTAVNADIDAGVIEPPTSDCVDWEYTISGNEVTITGYSGAATDLVIPATIEGLPVTTIGDYAFIWCDSLTSVTIGNGVTTIGDRAFSGCHSLTGIWVDANNSNYSSDDRGVLFNKDKTTLIQAPGAISGAYMIPDSVTAIGSDAFIWCDSLTSVTMGNSVTTIGDRAFSDCFSLTSVTMGNSVTTIGDFVFSNCDSLTSITIPDSVTTIGYGAFSDCSGLTSVTIGNGVTTIGDGMFYGCTSLTSVAIPDSVTSIGDRAFIWCDSLTSITIPDSVTTIGYRAFSHCDSLTTVYYGGTEAQRDAIAIGDYNEQLLSATWHYTEEAEITAQPESAESKLDDYVTFTVGVNVDNVTYQWQYKAANSEKWLNSTAQDATTAALRVQMKAYRAGQQYRCIITTADGEVLTSDPATMTLQAPSVELLGQPESVVANKGDSVSFTANVTGNDLKIQWYISTNNWKTWTTVSCTEKTLSLTANAAAWYKCKITDGSGKTVWTEPAQLTVMIQASIEAQPESVEAFVGSAVQFSVVANNAASYRWQYKLPGDDTWYNSYSDGYNTAAVSLEMKAYRDGYQYRCEITDTEGRISYSEPANLTLKSSSPVEIEEQPQQVVEGALNGWVTIHVEATGEPATFAWEYSSDGGKTWLKSYSEGYNTDTLRVQLKAYRNHYLYRCVITGELNQVVTNPTRVKLADSLT